MDWVVLDEATVTAHLPSDLATEYAAWLAANPGKAGRLAGIVANTVAEFRDNIRSNPANTLDPDENAIPQSCVRHAENIIFFQLAMEMGVDLDTEGSQSMTRADIFLRQIAFKRFNTTGGEAASSPSPSYAVPDTSTGRALPLLALIVLLLAPVAQAGWIAKPRSASLDTEIQVTLAPQHYTNTTTQLFGHLEGIDDALASVYSSPYFLHSAGDQTLAGNLTLERSLLISWYNSGTTRLTLEPPTGNNWPTLYPYYLTGSPFGAFGPVLYLYGGDNLVLEADDGVFLVKHGSAYGSIVTSLPASNTVWFSTNSYLTGLGNPTSLYFVTLSPPATNRITP